MVRQRELLAAIKEPEEWVKWCGNCWEVLRPRDIAKASKDYFDEGGNLIRCVYCGQRDELGDQQRKDLPEGKQND